MRRIFQMAAMAIVVMAAGAAPAAADLAIAKENGVTVTRGIAAPAPARYEAPVATVMALPRNFRGPVFGNHRLLIDGTVVERDRLVPRQRGCWCVRP